MQDTSTLPLGSSRKWTIASAVGAVLAALGASICCIGPLAFAVLGIGGAGLLVKFDAYRSYFTFATVGLLGLGFYFTYRPQRIAKGAASGPECICEHPKSNRLAKILLWVATVLVIGIWVFPFLAAQLFS